MKKGIQENNPVIALWNRVKIDGRIYGLAKEYRDKIKMPADGFHETEKFDIWHEAVKKSKKEEERIALSHEFIADAKKFIPYQGVMNEHGLTQVLIEFLYYTSVDEELLLKPLCSAMEVYILKDNKVLSINKKVPEDGVYIKISPFSTNDSIVKYVDSVKGLIESAQEFFISISKLEKPRKFKISSHYERDSTILVLDEWSKKEIEEYFDIKADYKNMAVSQLMKSIGYHGVTDSIVKAVKQRRKIK